MTEVLQGIPVSVQTKEECAGKYGDRGSLSPRNICAASGDNDEYTSCGGDSGGALVCAEDVNGQGKLLNYRLGESFFKFWDGIKNNLRYIKDLIPLRLRKNVRFLNMAWS